VSVLESEPPRFTPADAEEIAAAVFDLRGHATDLGSERDQTFLLENGSGGAVLKISNSAERSEVLELEEAAIAHVCLVDPELPVMRPVAARSTYEGHHVRLFERLLGHKGGPDLTDDQVRDYCAVQARLNRALRSFFHPAAGRHLLWDLRRTAELRPLLPMIEDDARRAFVERVVASFESRVLPQWPHLPAQVVHGDFNLDNILLDDDGRISAILDFGDCGYSAQAGDLAIAVASLTRGRPLDDVFRIARIAIDGYSSVTPLEPLEMALMGDLVAARLAMIVAISAWRVQRYPENAEYIQAWDDDSWELLERFDELGPEAVAAEFGAEPPRAPTAALAQRRQETTGAILTKLTYTRPVHVVRGQGVWLYEADGQRLLDGYNNVPVVGHCHPRVTEAVVRQTRTLNTHARYLYEPLILLAERLIATMPPESGLDTVMLVNSGSEANDLAYRIATGATGATGTVITAHAYHGLSTATTALSPEEWPRGFLSPRLARIAPPGSGADLGAELDRALGELESLAATFLDGALMSDGIYTPSSDELRLLVERTHAAGGLYVADEVQAGHGRTGTELWSFAHHDIVPDVVTMGKPMGNGYPVAAVITRRDIAERFPFAGRTFSTFGGNPVAAAAALAVLDVLRDERIPERVTGVGDRLRESIRALGKQSVVEVRGSGLIAGVQLTDAELARRAVDELRQGGVLIGRTGPGENVLKIRPPLAFRDDHTDIVISALDRVLT
jgi:4-aminobutyrate aminotransferase-like enzyme/Ser/Thr protein kinase RdoA (MazF antagonist)